VQGHPGIRPQTGGSGYKLRMRDMEIRGVGNCLGWKQSGQMETMRAFESQHCENCAAGILAEIQGQDIPAVGRHPDRTTITAFIPAEWITEPTKKMAGYRERRACGRQGRNCWSSRRLDRPTYGALPAARLNACCSSWELKLDSPSAAAFRGIKNQKTQSGARKPDGKNRFRLAAAKGLPQHLQPAGVPRRPPCSTAKSAGRPQCGLSPRKGSSKTLMGVAHAIGQARIPQG